MGANVTGIEPQHDNISAAIAHAQADPVVSERTTYLAVTAEELASSGLFQSILSVTGDAVGPALCHVPQRWADSFWGPTSPAPLLLRTVKACSCCEFNLT